MNCQPLLIGVVGDSLSLPRVFDGIAFHDTYAWRLAEWWRQRGRAAQTWMMAKAGVPIEDLIVRYREFQTYVGRRQGGIGLLHVGIVDCAPRPIPYRLRRLVSRLPGAAAAPIFRFLHAHRRRLLRAGVFFRFTPRAEFVRHFRTLSGEMTQDFERVYVVNIAPAGAEMSERSPGLAESIIEYNALIETAIAQQTNSVLVDVWHEFSYPAEADYVSRRDGHHLTMAGHDRILQLITEGEIKHCAVAGEVVGF